MDLFSCRICLSSDKLNLLSLFLSNPEQNYAEMVEYISGVVISQNDSLPQSICCECLNQIKSACTIKRKCVDTDQVLRQLVKDEFGLDMVIEPKIEDLDGIYNDNQFENVNFELKPDYNEAAMNDISFNNIRSDSKVVKHPKPSYSRHNDQKQECPLEHYESSIHDKSNEFYKCNNCEKSFKRKRQYEKHSDNCSTYNSSIPEEDDFQCFICNEKFVTIVLKKNHIKEKHTDKRTCTICNQKLLTPLSLEDHIFHHFHTHRFICHLCGKGYRMKGKLTAHIRSRHEINDSKYWCDICGYYNKRKNMVRKHVTNIHLNLKSFKCTLCKEHKYEYTTKDGLNMHLYSCHNVEPPYKCLACDKGFPKQVLLNTHKRLKCKGFVAPENRPPMKLPNFVMVEEIDSGFKCKVCNKIFHTRDLWVDHDNITHRVFKQCERETCKSKFATYYGLIRHVKVVHENLKFYTCEFCNKKFGQREALHLHRRTHTGDKPFSCKFCSFASGDASSVRKHEKKRHPNLHEHI